jgi:hypothetical protein
MTSPTTNKFSPEVRDRAVRLVLDHEREHPSRWAAITSSAGSVPLSHEIEAYQRHRTKKLKQQQRPGY